MVTKNKKQLTEKIIKNNSKEHPIDLDIFSKEEVHFVEKYSQLR